MKACWRETITGVGTVIMGPEESMVHLGQVKANKVACDSSHSRLVDRQAGESAATVVRSMDGKAATSPQVTLYGLSPGVETPGRGRLGGERLDAKGERDGGDLPPASRVAGKFHGVCQTRHTVR